PAAGPPRARIQKTSRREGMGRAVESDRQLDTIGRELDFFNCGLLMHFRTGFGGMIEQHLVEITARHLVSVIGLRTVAVLEVKLGSRIRARAHDFAAVFFYEPCAQKFFMQPEPGERFHAERQQRFADVKPRKFFAFEYNHSAPGTREQRSSRAAGWSASNDRDIVHAAAHDSELSKLSTLW